MVANLPANGSFHSDPFVMETKQAKVDNDDDDDLIKEHGESKEVPKIRARDVKA